MEHHRLKPMKPGYDKKLFDELYKKTAPLRRKLAYEIDARKFGVDYNEILSWFDVKFIHCFNKYWDTENKRLLGYIINGLTTYKYRIMRSSYQVKYHEHANMIDISTYYEHDSIMDDNSSDVLVKEKMLTTVMEYMQEHLSDDALLVFDIQLNPPLFITSRLVELGKKEYSKIPNDILAEYLSLPINDNVIRYLNNLRVEIKKGIDQAKKFFNSPSQQLQLA